MKKKVGLSLIFYINIYMKGLRKTKSRTASIGWDCNVKITLKSHRVLGVKLIILHSKEYEYLYI
jgi:hypothetical protein